MSPKDNSGSSMPPRVKLGLKPGRSVKFWPEVRWCSEAFEFDHVRGLDGEEIEYASVIEMEALLAAARAESRAEAFEEMYQFTLGTDWRKQTVFRQWLMEKAKQAREEKK